MGGGKKYQAARLPATEDAIAGFSGRGVFPEGS